MKTETMNGHSSVFREKLQCHKSILITRFFLLLFFSYVLVWS